MHCIMAPCTNRAETNPSREMFHPWVSLHHPERYKKDMQAKEKDLFGTNPK
ncbi:AAEL005154-PA [Aedes aegypti]|uniref:AAEL005154-PA n=1 Tax=Aedes aegypti TaxID=7159 RepID=Q17AX6_AEDAE|nr:AAEL005154-PA [Aedes aegypti]